MSTPHAAAASALMVCPMKTAFVAVTAAAVRCRQYVKNQVVDQDGAVAASELRMLNSLAILEWLKAVFWTNIAAGPKAPFADTIKGMKMALRSKTDAMALGTRFFCISAPLRMASVRERALSDSESGHEGAGS